MEPNKLIKDKNKLLMAIPVILGILFLYVFFIREDGNVPSGSDRQAASQAFLEPQSEMADKVNDKMEAYKAVPLCVLFSKTPFPQNFV